MPEDAQMELQIRKAVDKHASDCWVGKKVTEMNGHIDEIHRSQGETAVHVQHIRDDVQDLKGGFTGMTKLLIGTLLTFVGGLGLAVVIYLIKGG